MTARKFSARGVAVAAIVSVGLLSGCTATGWVAEAPPAAGVQAQTEALQKARNVMFVVDDSGEGVLLGAITSVDPAKVSGIRYTPELPDGSAGSEDSIDFTADIPINGAVTLGGPDLAVSNDELSPGRLADVTIEFDGGAPLTLKVPVYSAEHEDYAEAWSEAVEG